VAAITIGEVHVTFDGDTLTITQRDQPDVNLSLSAAEVKELIDFVTSFAGSGFNRRQTFRVPLRDSGDLSVQIRRNEKEVSATATDIGLTGIFVEQRRDAWLDLSLDDDVEVIIEFEGQAHTYHGVVRRRQDNGYGLFFPESIRGEHVDPPPHLLEIVMELQRRWMAQRIGGVK